MPLYIDFLSVSLTWQLELREQRLCIFISQQLAQWLAYNRSLINIELNQMPPYCLQHIKSTHFWLTPHPL